MYSKSDVEEILGDLLGQIKDRVRRDLESQTNMSALVLEGVFASADERGVPLAVEMARTEDEHALSRIRELNTALIADADLKKRTGAKLESMRDEHARLVADNQRMADEAKALRERYSTMEAQASAASRQSAELSGRVASLTAELGGLRSGLSAADATKAAHEAEVQKLRGAVADLSASLERTKVWVAAVPAQRRSMALLHISPPTHPPSLSADGPPVPVQGARGACEPVETIRPDAAVAAPQECSAGRGPSSAQKVRDCLIVFALQRLHASATSSFNFAHSFVSDMSRTRRQRTNVYFNRTYYRASTIHISFLRVHNVLSLDSECHV